MIMDALPFWVGTHVSTGSPVAPDRRIAHPAGAAKENPRERRANVARAPRASRAYEREGAREPPERGPARAAPG
jgi:hypothetical protein